MSEIPKRQHFVPRFHLSNFCNDQGKVWAFNTQYKTIKEYSVTQIASQEYFYEVNPNAPDGKLEKLLSELENNCSQIFKHIIDTKSLKELSDDDRFDLGLYVLAQQHRTSAALSNSIEFQQGFRERVGDWIRELEGNREFKFPDENPKLLWRSTLISSIERVPLLLEKKWVLLISDREFYISDNPSVLNNEIIRLHRGNLGLKNKGIQLFLPLSDSVTLAIFCPEHYNVDHNRTLPYMPEFVQIVNYLQVENSEQFVYSSQKDFALAKDMVEKGQNQRPRPFFA